MRYHQIITESALPKVTPELVEEVTNAILQRGFELPEGDDGELDEDYVKYAIFAALDEISVAVVGDQLPIYRAIEVNDAAKLNLHQLGIYWTTDLGLAHPYNGAGAKQWLTIEAKVKLSNINWAAVLAVHLEGGESEITLDQGTPLQIINARWVSHVRGYQPPAAPTNLIGQPASA